MSGFLTNFDRGYECVFFSKVNQGNELIVPINLYITCREPRHGLDITLINVE
jgi:hypothetical protein